MARAPALTEIEAMPEADRLEGFAHPRETAELFGHVAIEHELAEAFAGGRMHHGWLISGTEGIGKATLAYKLAAFVLADATERAAAGGRLAVPALSRAARQVKALSHPGLLVIRRPYDPKSKRFVSAIPVDEVRRLRTFLGHTAAQGSWRVVIVDPADEMNPSAANAILKSLEEPPPQTVFLLITSAPGRLLATIRSRCRTLELAGLDDEALGNAVAQALAAAGKPALAPGELERLATMSEGSVRRVLALATSDGLKLLEKVNALVGLLPKVDWPAAHSLSDELALAANEQRFETFFELLEARIRDLVRARATGAGRADDIRLAARLVPDGRLADMAEAWQTIVAAKAEADAINLDRKALVLDAIGRLAAISARR